MKMKITSVGLGLKQSAFKIIKITPMGASEVLESIPLLLSTKRSRKN
jgi:hypothetical protein